jgi:basic membrane protein A
MSKRLFLLLTLFSIMALVVVACGGAQEETQQTVEEAQEQVQEVVEEAQEQVEEAVSEAGALDVEPVRIAIVMPSPTTDLAWSQAIYDATVRIQEKAGGEDMVEIAFSESMFNVTDAAAALRDYAADGYDLVIAHGTQYGSSLFEIAPKQHLRLRSPR